jgi:hypothetical protein
MVKMSWLTSAECFAHYAFIGVMGFSWVRGGCYDTKKFNHLAKLSYAVSILMDSCNGSFAVSGPQAGPSCDPISEQSGQ